ncbi:MAG: hypothetical protein NXI32_14665 [bacterium]|nr:hypothetical protein [bacterium]
MSEVRSIDDFELASRSASLHQYVTGWGAIFAKRAEDKTRLPWLNKSQGKAAIGE